MGANNSKSDWKFFGNRRKLCVEDVKQRQTQEVPMPESAFITMYELCGRLKISRPTAIAAIKRGILPRVQVGIRSYRFHWPSVEKAISRLAERTGEGTHDDEKN